MALTKEYYIGFAVGITLGHFTTAAYNNWDTVKEFGAAAIEGLANVSDGYQLQKDIPPLHEAIENPTSTQDGQTPSF